MTNQQNSEPFLLWLFTNNIDKKVKKHEEKYNVIRKLLNNHDDYPDFESEIVRITNKEGIEKQIRNKLRNLVVVLYQHPDDKPTLYEEVLHLIKGLDPYAELINVTETKEENYDGSKILLSGYFGHFQPTFMDSVLVAQIRAANFLISSRRARYDASSKLTLKTETVEDISLAIVEEFRKLIDCDDNDVEVNLVWLSERNYLQGDPNRLKSLVRTSIFNPENFDYTPSKKRLDRPIRNDDLIYDILSDRTKQIVFPDLPEEFDKKIIPDAQSWIALPLKANDKSDEGKWEHKPIALLTATLKTKIDYADVNIIRLLQFANESALALQTAQRNEEVESLRNALTSVAEKHDLQDILQVISREACKLINGLFSYIVVPDDEDTKLEYCGAWDHEYEEEFLSKLKTQYPCFPLHGQTKGGVRKGENKDKAGITVLSYMKKELVLLDDCRNLFQDQINSIREQSKSLESYLEFKYKTNGKEVQSGSAISIPIMDEKTERVLGIFCVEHQFPCGFTTSQIETLKQFADFAKIAILDAETRKRTERLFKSSAEIPSFTDKIDEYYHDIAESIREATGANAGVKIFAKIDNITKLIGYSKDTILQEGDQHSRKDGHTVWAINNQRPVIIPNVDYYVKHFEQEKRYLSAENKSISIKQTTLDNNIKAVICIPMTLQKQEHSKERIANGAIWLHFTAPQTDVNPQDENSEQLRELKLYANRAAVSLDNDIERKLLKISEAISVSSPDQHQEVADEIVEYLRDRFDVAGVLFYVDEPGKKLRRIACSTVDGKSFMQTGETVKYGSGLVGNLFIAMDKDGYEYSGQTIHIPNYSEDYDHAIKKEADKGILHSLFAIRLHATLTNEKIGILVFAGHDVDRKYDESEEDLLRFARLAGNLLAHFTFSPSPSLRRRIFQFAFIFTIIFVSTTKEVFVGESEIDLTFRFLLAFIATLIIMFAENPLARITRDIIER